MTPSAVRDFTHLAVSNRDETQEAIGVSLAKNTDASTLSFPLPLVVGAILFAASIVGSMWMVVSDVRDIRTRIELQGRVDEATTKLQDERAKNMQDAIDSMQRRLELVQLQYQQLRETVIQQKR